ncbi:MAG: hypothetical protein HYV09_26080, partial [Deltaproteobacteria bacterium]|nr:hypothetical protein [Deltaproteobacteria bacterium]
MRTTAAMVIGTALFAAGCEQRAGERPTTYASERTAQLDLADAGGAPKATPPAPPSAVGGGPPAAAEL